MVDALPETIKAGTLMELCGINAVTVGRLVKAGKIERGEVFGTYPISAIAGVMAHFKEQLDAKPTADSTPEKRFRHYRAVQAKLKAEEMAGILVDVEKVEQAISAMTHRAIARLSAIPDGACAALRELLGEDQEEALAEVRKILDTRIRDACSELSNLNEADLANISPEIDEIVCEEGGIDGEANEIENP